MKEQIPIFNYEKPMLSIANAVKDRNKKKVRKICRKALFRFYKTPEAQDMVEKVTASQEDYRAMAAWTFFNLYYAIFPQPDPMNPNFNKVVKILSSFLREDDENLKAASLFALGNLGLFAVKAAMKSAKPCPVTSCLSSKEPYTREAARFALDNINQKPTLQHRELKTIRVDMGLDVPAHQEAILYGDDAPKDPKPRTKEEREQEKENMKFESGRGGNNIILP